MLNIYKAFFLVGIALFSKTIAKAQVPVDSTPVSVNVDLEQIFNSKTPKEYIIADIKVSGAFRLSTNLKDNEWMISYQNLKRRFDCEQPSTATY